MRRLLPLFLISFAIGLQSEAAEIAENDERPRFDAELVDAISKRLALMPEVAKYKWLNGLPIERPAREAELIEKLSSTVPSAFRTSARQALRAQIEASKSMQRQLFAAWRNGDPPTEALSLDVSRQRIDRVTQDLMQALAGHDREVGFPRCRNVEPQAPVDLVRFVEAWQLAIDGVLGEPCEPLDKTAGR